MIKKLPLVSILVPIYGVEKCIKDCVDSLLMQSYNNIEYIFVNDCTPDNSITILKETAAAYQKKIIIVNNPHNLGSASSRNVGLDVAKGDYICFVDSDDILPQNAIESLVDAAQCSGADIIRGQLLRFSNGWQGTFSKFHQTDIVSYRTSLLDWGTIPVGVWGGLYKKDLFSDNLRFFDGLNFGEDFGLSTRLALKANSVKVVSETVYLYRINEKSMTQVYTEKNAKDLIDISDRIKKIYENRPDYNLYKSAINRGRARMKTIMLLQLDPKVTPQYTDIFPELKDEKLPFEIRAKLWAMEHNYRLVYKVFNRIFKKR